MCFYRCCSRGFFVEGCCASIWCSTTSNNLVFVVLSHLNDGQMYIDVLIRLPFKEEMAICTRVRSGDPLKTSVDIGGSVQQVDSDRADPSIERVKLSVPPNSTILLFLLRLLDTMDWVTSLLYIYNYRP